MSIGQIIAFLESWAPPGQKLEYDRVGLQVGDPLQPVERVLVALDVTPDVVDEAVAQRADLLLSHHPLLFRPLGRLTTDDYTAKLAYRLAQAGIAYYALHTNLDAARDGVSFGLAEVLELQDIRFLDPLPKALVKLVTFVPHEAAEGVLAALAEAGAGRIGEYRACAFTQPGTGRFQPLDTANPAIGQPGGPVEEVPELRLEVEVARWDVGRVVAALRSAHPYEEVAYDLYPVEQPSTQAGMGAVGELPEAMPLRDFLPLVASRLAAGALRYVGDPAQPIRRVAVCGGAGSSLLPHALRVRADAFVTADVTYHTFFQPLDPDGAPRLALIDPGHYESECAIEQRLVERLAARFPEVHVTRTRHWTSPMRTFVP